MNAEDRERQLAQTQFAADLRSQFEALGERARPPRKRRRVVVVAVAAGVIVATMLGGVALAGGFHFASPPQPLHPAATPGGSPRHGAAATSVYPTNAKGQTYGPNRPMAQEPDLIAATATNGRDGYVLRTDLEGPVPSTPAEALRMQAAQAGKDRVIPVYESDGTTQIGVFVIGSGSVTEVVAQPPDWLLKQMSGLARNAGDPQASALWTLTTADKAVVVEGTDAPAKVADPHAPVYVFVVHGHFTKWLWSLPAGVSPPHYSWVVEEVDAGSRITNMSGNSEKPIDTSGLTMQRVVLPSAADE